MPEFKKGDKVRLVKGWLERLGFRRPAITGTVVYVRKFNNVTFCEVIWDYDHDLTPVSADQLAHIK